MPFKLTFNFIRYFWILYSRILQVSFDFSQLSKYIISDFFTVFSFCFLTADPCLFQSITHVIVSSIKEALIWRLLSHFCNADWTTFARTSSCNYALRLCSSFNKIAHFSRRESIHKSTASPLLPRCSITTQVSHKLWRSYYTGIWKHFGESLQLAIIINHSLLLIKTLLIRTSPSVFQGSYPSVVIINLSY